MSLSRFRPCSPLQRLLLVLLALSLLGNGLALAEAPVAASDAPCAGMMHAPGLADCCDHGQPGQPMAPDCVEHCLLLAQLAASLPVAQLGPSNSLAPACEAPAGNLAQAHSPTCTTPGLRPPISA